MYQHFMTIKLNWQLLWRNRSFRYKLFVGGFLITIILICFPYFFQYIEQRNGVVLNDGLLFLIPPHNVSVLIFILIWSSSFFMLLTAVRKPGILLTFLIAYVILCLCRIVTILAFPLEAPPGLIELADPLSNSFYGGPFITKDLFFSGHVSALFLMYLCQPNRFLRYYAMVASILVAVLVLVQHIHYTIDVVFAFFFAYACFFASIKLVNVKLFCGND
jgi:hypothetical protein